MRKVIWSILIWSILIIIITEGMKSMEYFSEEKRISVRWKWVKKSIAVGMATKLYSNIEHNFNLNIITNSKYILLLASICKVYSLLILIIWRNGQLEKQKWNKPKSLIFTPQLQNETWILYGTSTNFNPKYIYYTKQPV